VPAGTAIALRRERRRRQEETGARLPLPERVAA
jgi:hypothetical protein